MMTVQKSLFEDQKMIVQMISSGTPLKNILSFIVNSIENHCDSNRVSGSVMLYNSFSNQLADTVSASLPSSFISTMEPVNVSPYGGSCGTAAFLKQPVFIADIEYNPLWEEYRHIALVHGYRACWSIPLLSSNKELLGAIVLYSSEVGGPTKEILHVLNFFSQSASFAIEVFQNNLIQLQDGTYSARKSISYQYK